MTLSFEDIFSNFLGYVTDYNIASMNMQDAYDMMTEWLNKAFRKPYVRSLFLSSSIDNEIQVLTFEMLHKKEDVEDSDFVSDVLSKGMVVEWLAPQVNSKLLTQQMFSGKEQKFYAQSNQLNELKGLYENTRREQRSMIGERNGINNSYLGDQ